MTCILFFENKFAENNGNHSTPHSIHFALCVLNLCQCHCHAVVHFAHHPDRRRLLSGAEILSILIKVVIQVNSIY